MPSPYEKDNTIKRDFSYRNVCIITDILNSKKTETYISELSKIIGVKSSNMIKIINYLKKIKVIKELKNIGNTKIININRSLLKHFLDEQEVYFVDKFHKEYNKITYKDF